MTFSLLMREKCWLPHAAAHQKHPSCALMWILKPVSEGTLEINGAFFCFQVCQRAVATCWWGAMVLRCWDRWWIPVGLKTQSVYFIRRNNAFWALTCLMEGLQKTPCRFTSRILIICTKHLTKIVSDSLRPELKSLLMLDGSKIKTDRWTITGHRMQGDEAH